MGRKVAITSAVTGSFDTVHKNPAVPVTPEEIARSAIEAARAGAAIAHIHVRDPATGKPSMAVQHYREVVERIRDSGVDLILNLTTGAGARFVPGDGDHASFAEGTTFCGPHVRVRHIEQLRPEICSLDVATMNFGEHAFVNVPRHLKIMAERARDSGAKPEIEVFDSGHIRLALRLIEEGHIDPPPLFQLCLGIAYGAPASPESTIHLRRALPDDAVWSAFAIGASALPMAALSIILGGHVRVGLEDTLYLAKGVLAPSNAALVDKAVTLVETLGASVATTAEVREIFRLSGSAAARGVA